MQTRSIPATGEMLPVIGCGTWSVFDVGPAARERAPLGEVLDALFSGGGTVVDSSPMYGRAEDVLGALLDQASLAPRAFVATKVWTEGRDAGIRQMEQSFRRLRVDRIDLMQIHNLVDWRTHLPTLRQWKDAGRFRYIGITHYTASGYDELEAAMRAEPFDFVQLNHSLEERDAETRLLPLAAARGMGVVVNRPFGGGRLIAALHARPLPAWAGTVGCASWAQLALKFILAQASVTCVIPATRRRQHMHDNCVAADGAPLDPAMRRELVDIVDSL